MNDNLKNCETINIFNDFQEVDDLGVGTWITLLVKYQKEKQELIQHRTSFIEAQKKNRFGPLLLPLRANKWPGGFAAAMRLETKMDVNKSLWNLAGEEVRGLSVNGARIVVAFVNSLGIYATNRGNLIKTIHHPSFKNLHSATFCPVDGKRILVSNSGLDNILEIDVDSEQIIWQWDAWKHGYEKNPFGLHLLSNDRVSNEIPQTTDLSLTTDLPLTTDPKTQILSHHEAKQKIAAGITIPGQQTWAVVVERQQVDHPLGLEKWLKGAEPNWAGYDHDPDYLLASLFVANEVVRIHKKTGKVQVIQDGLSRPHGLVPYSHGYLVSNTRKGEVLTLDQQFSMAACYNFTGIPLPNVQAAYDGEWLQFTNPIGTNNLLASVDSRRSMIVIWDPMRKVYSMYPVPTAWSVHAVLGFDTDE